MGLFGKKEEAVAVQEPIVSRGKKRVEPVAPPEPVQEIQEQMSPEVQASIEEVKAYSAFSPADGMTVGEATICNLLFTMICKENKR